MSVLQVQGVVFHRVILRLIHFFFSFHGDQNKRHEKPANKTLDTNTCSRSDGTNQEREQTSGIDDTCPTRM